MRWGLRGIRESLLASVCLGVVNAHATDAIWSPTPDNNNWNDGANWVSTPPHAVPDGTATFGTSSKTSIVFSQNFTAINNMSFSSNAPSYTFFLVGTQGLDINGNPSGSPRGGIDVAFASSFLPNFNVQSQVGLTFHNFAVANANIFNIAGGATTFRDSSTTLQAQITNDTGTTLFVDNSTAVGNATHIVNVNGGATFFFNSSRFIGPASGTIDNNGNGTATGNSFTAFGNTSSAAGGILNNTNGGQTQFFDQSTADNLSSDPALAVQINNSSGGSTSFFNQSKAIAASILNMAGGSLSFFDTSSAGGAHITNQVGGSTTFLGNSTAGNASFFNDGMIVFGANSKAGTATFINGPGQIVFFGTADSATITNQTGPGQTVFALSSTAGHATITNVAGGTTSFQDSSTADHAIITNSNSGSTSFFNSSMAGNATIINQNNASTSFADTSTADNATILNKLGGIVLFRGNSTGGNATITNDGGATTFIDNSCPGGATITAINGGFINYAQSGACPTPGPKPKIIVGQGSKIDISGLLIPGITFDSIEGLGTVFLGSKALTIGVNGLSTVFGGVLADGGSSGGTGGSLVKVGPGTLILAGANTYTGGTAVNDGILDVAGSLASAVVVNSGGTVMGSGVIADLVVGPGAIVAPGNSIGTLTVNGNALFQPGSIYQAETNAAGQSDKIVVAGTATLAGGTVQVLAQSGSYARQTRYTILTANGGVSGTFAGVSSNLAFLTPILSYDPNDVFLMLNRNDLTFAALAQTPNQRSVAGALDLSPGSSRLVQPIINLTGLAALQAFDALSGELHGSVQATIVDDSRYVRQAVLGRLRQAPYAGGSGAMAALGSGGPTLAYAEPATDAALAYADKKSGFPIKAPPLATPMPTPDLTFWAQGVGAWGKINGDGNAADVSRNLGGFFAGFDRRFGDAWRAGLAAGYTNSSVSLSARASSANIDTAYLAAYAGTSFWAWNFRSGATFAWNTIGTSRAIAFPGFSEQATTRYGAGESQVFGELGYGMTFGTVAAEPYAGLAWVHLDTARFTETGGVSALAGTGNKDDLGYSTLGARAATFYILPNGIALIPRASVAWQHAFGTVAPGAALSFQSTGAAFSIGGVPIARDAALIETGGDLQLTPQAKVAVFYAGQLADHAHDHSVKGNFTWRF
jgi:outer membrane autotransporter protein